MDLCNSAVVHGQVGILKWLKENGYRFNYFELLATAITWERIKVKEWLKSL